MRTTILLFVLLLASCNSATKQNQAKTETEMTTEVSFKNLNVSGFKNAMKTKEIVLIDVRTPGEIAQGKIEDALELDINDKDFTNKVNDLDKSKDYYLYCKMGGRSSKAAQIMIDNGFENVYNLEGGFDAWKKVEK